MVSFPPARVGDQTEVLVVRPAGDPAPSAAIPPRVYPAYSACLATCQHDDRLPLASGALTGKYSATHRPAGWRKYMGMFRGKGLAKLERVNAVLRDVAGQHGKTPSQFA